MHITVSASCQWRWGSLKLKKHADKQAITLMMPKQVNGESSRNNAKSC